MQTKNIYARWKDREISDELALETLCRTLATVQDSLEPLTEMEKQTRAYISEIVSRMGGKARVEGFGNLQITSPTVVSGYDRDGLDSLVEELSEQGYTEIAERIKSYRRATPRVGSLRINRLDVTSAA